MIKKVLKYTLLTLILLAVLVTGVFLFVPSIQQQVYFAYLNTQITTVFEVRGNEIHMSGVINSRTYDQFVEITSQNPSVNTLVEVLAEGSMDDDTMIKLAYYVRDQKFNTKLLPDSEIYSGGVDLFLAGVERIVELNEQGQYPHIGVHSWSDGFNEAKSFPRDAPEHQQNRDYIERMLGKDDFYWFTIYAAPAEGMHKMTNEEIIKYGLATQVIPFDSPHHSGATY